MALTQQSIDCIKRKAQEDRDTTLLAIEVIEFLDKLAPGLNKSVAVNILSKCQSMVIGAF